VVAAFALAGGCGGGVFIPLPSVIVGTMSASFDTVEEFYALPAVADLLARSGIAPAVGVTPPPLAGDYAAAGDVQHDDYRPQDEGTPVQQVLRFFAGDPGRIGFSLDGALGSFTDVAASTTSAIVTGSGDAFTVHFHVTTFQERDVFDYPYGCFESRVGVVHGVRLPDGSLDLTLASVTTGLEGRWVSHLRWNEGVEDAEMVGSLRILRLTATP
jgi:hypothetical protein